MISLAVKIIYLIGFSLFVAIAMLVFFPMSDLSGHGVTAVEARAIRKELVSCGFYYHDWKFVRLLKGSKVTGIDLKVLEGRGVGVRSIFVRVSENGGSSVDYVFRPETQEWKRLGWSID
ncbi:hypothetical protein OKA04_00155 [Luteolibacter flavescens]|uniref:Uncharacterized protein n=1 Tax=Luteolibacter flavescens TaxID=1859460 RepID=A0ABT3FHR8_9BACT|nr:hypothetical protein [Luteolibacter flavescens]MCW1883118.1 hypothetical protein [Luteolibacter flavescens]